MPGSNPKILSGFIIVTGGQALAFALSFSRNLILARLLSKFDFGLAATFALAVGLMDLAGRMSFGMQVVQAEEGDSEKFLKTAHLFQLVAGMISTGAMLLMCVPLAYLFKVPDKAWAFSLLSLVPLLRGLENLHYVCRQRQFDFMPSLWVELIPQVILTALAWPLAIWINDFRVVLILIIAKALLNILLSHALAARAYRWGWDKALVQGMWKFSWPLIINGFIMFAAMQGDQILVGGGYSLEVLALYSAGASLIAVPFQILAQASMSILLPALSRFQGSANQFYQEYKTVVRLSAVMAVVTLSPLIIGGEQIIRLLFGPKYAGGGGIIAWLATGTAFRFLRIAPATAAMAKADTQNNMFSNILRISSLLPASAVLVIGGPVEALAASAFFGELVAMFGSTYRLNIRQAIPFADTLKSIAYIAACLTGAWVLLWIGAQKWALPTLVGVSGLYLVFALAVARFVFPEEVGRLWHGMVSLKKRGQPWITLEKQSSSYKKP